MDKQTLKALKKELLQQQKAEKLKQQKALQSQRDQEANNTRDEDIFREAMSGVTPLDHSQSYHEQQEPSASPVVRSFEEELIIHDTLSDELEVDDVGHEEILSFCRTGIQNNVFRKLRAGNYSISDELDLHGCTLKQAKQILLYFLQETVQFESCCVRIIHGKGHRSGSNKPVLKTQVNHWLREHERVLAFHSAKAKDGGNGAVYVLLKTQ